MADGSSNASLWYYFATMDLFRAKPTYSFDLPLRLQRLQELAYNMWWTWHPEATRLLGRLDYDLWESLGHNPILFLRQVTAQRLNQALEDEEYLALYDAVFAMFDTYMQAEDLWARRVHPELTNHPIAYFSMEYGLHEMLPIYSGGLGILAGDHLKESSDLGLPLVGVGLMYSEGYFAQRVSEDGWQTALNRPMDFEQLPVLPVLGDDGHRLTVEVEFPDRQVSLQIWEVHVGRIPLYLLDSDLQTNAPSDRILTARLYWADLDNRIMQEMLLGIGGVRALRLLGYNPAVWHMNEGHAAFLTLERARERVQAGRDWREALTSTSRNNVFTTHTPVPAGNDEFPLWLTERRLAAIWPQLNLDREQFFDLGRHKVPEGETFSMGVLALRNSMGRNAVSELHSHVSRRMWNFLWPDRSEDQVPITYVTNGVHTANWMARRLRLLLDKYLGPEWQDRLDEAALWQGVDAIPDAELWAVRTHLKRRLAFYMRERVRSRWTEGGYHPIQVVASGVLINPYALTIAFARRFAAYKRADLILSDVDRLLGIINRANRPVQILFAGKAHPADEAGKLLLQKVYREVKRAEASGRLVFLEDYDINLARYLVQGVDVWLNTPRRPLEASGTSGMKAALNGVLNFSVLDGWWREAYNGRNGWAIGKDEEHESSEAQDALDASSLYSTLEDEIVPLFYERDPREISHYWIARMKESMKTIIPRFSTRRMVKEYIERLYVPALT
ncbi:MAG TPA: alpha-glucan family phosphorylase [Anaerolineales bacterium]|nr:alpha-glucan family phosphorylase [Anaerolineales bacterium]